MTDIAAVVAKADLPVIVGSVTTVKRAGKEYKAICPFHDDHNPSLGIWHAGDKWRYRCYACEEEGDALDFVMNFYKIARPEGLERLGAEKWQALPGKTTKARSGPAAQRITSKPPADAPEPSLIHPEFGKPLAVFPIRDFDGSIISYEVRYADKEGEKQPRIWTWGNFPNQVAGWRLGVSSGARPLYGLERLALRPDAPVACFEGPKKADAGHKLLGSIYACVSWTGGHSVCFKHDWTPLKGRKVLVCPDADAVGLAAGQSLCSMLSETLGCSVRWTNPTGRDNGWDIADWTGTAAEYWEWAKPRTKDWVAASPEDAPGSPQSDPAPPEPPDNFPPEATKQRPIPRSARPYLAVNQGNVVPVPAEEPDGVPLELTELSTAKVFAKRHQYEIKTVQEWGSKHGPAWMAWTGTRWRREPRRVTAWQRADELAVTLDARAAALGVTMPNRFKFQSERYMSAILNLAGHQSEIVAHADDFDADPWILGTPAGTVDLRTGKMRPARPDDYLTRQTTVAPSSGPHPLFDDVMRRTSGGDPEVLAWLWRWLGYICSGSCREEKFLYLLGAPGAGKTTLIEVIAAILGPTEKGGYATQTDVSLFTETQLDKGSDRLASLAGARFAYASEAEEGKNFKASLLKLATGGDTLRGRFLYSESFQFKPTHKLWVFGNHRLGLKTADDGVRRRLALLEYRKEYLLKPEERDLDYKSKLVVEYPQILASMIAACLRYQEAGALGEPEAVSMAVADYTETEDVLGAYCYEQITVDHTARTSISDAYQDYKRWAESAGEFVVSSKRFSQAMRERGFRAVRTAGKRYLEGFRLNQAPAASPRYPAD